MPATLKIKLNTRSHHNEIMGWDGDRLKVSVTAAPTNDEANEALFDVLAEELHLPKTSFRIKYGAKEPNKTLEVWNTNNVFLYKRIEQYTHFAFPLSKKVANDGDAGADAA